MRVEADRWLLVSEQPLALTLPSGPESLWWGLEIKAGIPNLCRCGVYPRLIRAVRRAGAAMRLAQPAEPTAPGAEPALAAPAGPSR